MAFKGYTESTIKAYESRQSQIATEMGITGRYAGRIVNDQVRPDIILNDGRYFIPHNDGPDTIQTQDIKTNE